MATKKKIKRDKDMLTVGEVADKLNVKTATIRIWIHRGRFPGAEITETPGGSYWLIPIEAVRDFKMRKAGRPKKKAKKS